MKTFNATRTRTYYYTASVEAKSKKEAIGLFQGLHEDEWESLDETYGESSTLTELKNVDVEEA